MIYKVEVPVQCAICTVQQLASETSTVGVRQFLKSLKGEAGGTSP